MAGGEVLDDEVGSSVGLLEKKEVSLLGSILVIVGVGVGVGVGSSGGDEGG